MRLIFGFMTFASACAVMASLERLLGRPIPRFARSRAVRQNRAFAAVLIAMVMAFSLLLNSLLHVVVCSHCSKPYAWQYSTWIFFDAVVAFCFNVGVGWIVFAILLSITTDSTLGSMKRHESKRVAVDHFPVTPLLVL
jgi:hypothetical protein